MNDAICKNNNVPYERRVVAGLGNGKMSGKNTCTDKVFPLHSRSLYSESRIRVSFSCSFVFRDDSHAINSAPDISKYCPKNT